jgi:hypothetical protein
MTSTNRSAQTRVSLVLHGAENIFRMVVAKLSIRSDNGPINTVAELEKYVSTRSAFVAQKKLYGYLKTRMGTRYPSMFEDDIFVVSINIAKYHVFEACLSDFIIFAVAHAFNDSAVADAKRAAIAARCFEVALSDNADGAPQTFSPGDAIEAFADRLAGTQWRSGALMAENFTRSPKALIEWAPVAPRLKEFDTEIVENSIRYAWQEIRAQYLKRLDGAALIADCSGSEAARA